MVQHCIVYKGASGHCGTGLYIKFSVVWETKHHHITQVAIDTVKLPIEDNHVQPSEVHVVTMQMTIQIQLKVNSTT